MKKGMFIQNNGIFNDQILVTFNMTTDQVSEALKKEKNVVKGIHEWILGVKKHERVHDKGFVYSDREKSLCWLSLLKWDASWQSYECLLHECVHLMQFYKEGKGFDDDETEAYLVEFLFREIRNKLPKH